MGQGEPKLLAGVDDALMPMSYQQLLPPRHLHPASLLMGTVQCWVRAPGRARDLLSVALLFNEESKIFYTAV